MANILVVGTHVHYSVIEGRYFCNPINADMLSLFEFDSHDYTYGFIPLDSTLSANTREVDPNIRSVALLKRPLRNWPIRVLDLIWLHFRLLRVISHVDIVFARLPAYSGFAAVRVTRFRRRRLWLSVHGDVSDILRYQSQESSGPRRIISAIRARYARHRTHKAMSWAEKRFFVGNDLQARYLPSGGSGLVFAHHMHSKDHVASSPKSFASPHLRVGFIGELIPKKGAVDLVDALSRSKDRGLEVELLIAGEGSQAAMLRDLADSYAIAESVHFLGWLAHGQELETFYERTDVLVLPAVAGEGVPKVCIEAMVRGIPVVGTRVGSLPELLGHGTRGFLVDPQDPAALSEVLENIWEQPGLAYDRASKALEYVRENSYEETRRRILEELAA